MSATTRKTPPARTNKPAPAKNIAKSNGVSQAEPVVAPALQKGPSETMTDTPKTADAVKETVKKATTEATNQAQAMFADLNERAKVAVEKSQKLAEEFTEFHKGNVEALVASAKVAAKGFETMGQDAAELGRKNFENAQAAFKSFAAVKSPTELFKLQSDYAKTSFDSFVAETSKSTEAALKLAGDIFQPLSNRFAVAAEKLKSAA